MNDNLKKAKQNKSFKSKSKQRLHNKNGKWMIDSDMSYSIDVSPGPSFVKHKQKQWKYNLQETDDDKLSKELFGEDVKFKFEPESKLKVKKLSNNFEDDFQENEEKSPEDDCIMSEEEDDSIKKPAWVDEDDEQLRVCDVVKTIRKVKENEVLSEGNYAQKLRDNFMQLYGDNPSWAGKSIEMDSSRRKTDSYMVKKQNAGELQKQTLVHKVLSNLNYNAASQDLFINAIQFHKKHQVAVVAGRKGVMGRATLCQIPSNNTEMETVKFESFPITFCNFLGEQSKFIVAALNRPDFYVYDMISATTIRIPRFHYKDKESAKTKGCTVSPDGSFILFHSNQGRLFLYDTKSLSYIETIEVPQDIIDVAFNANSSVLYIYTELGDIFIYDMLTRQCVHKFYDDGCIEASCITISPDDRLLACGSSRGIVNIYNVNGLSSSSLPTPANILSNLRTKVNCLEFSPTSEMLVMSSPCLNNAIKMIHLASMTAYENFPPAGFQSHRTSCLNFSPHGAYLLTGTNNGCAHLHRLFHYKEY